MVVNLTSNAMKVYLVFVCEHGSNDRSLIFEDLQISRARGSRMDLLMASWLITTSSA